MKTKTLWGIYWRDGRVRWLPTNSEMCDVALRDTGLWTSRAAARKVRRQRRRYAILPEHVAPFAKVTFCEPPTVKGKRP